MRKDDTHKSRSVPNFLHTFPFVPSLLGLTLSSFKDTFLAKALGMGYFLNDLSSVNHTRSSRNPSFRTKPLGTLVVFFWETLQSEAGSKPNLYKPSVLCDAACLHMVVLV